MRIQNNITAMNTHRMYTLNNDAVAASAKKLSSGYRINSAADDAAGLAISEKMRSQIRGLNMATKNSQDAISLVQTAEGALQETQNMLQRMNELAVQAATGTNETLDRNALAKEFEQLKREINDIAEQTNFNNMKILDGSLSYVGPDRSAFTSGINTTTESLNGATTSAITEVTSAAVKGENFVQGGPAAGAKFTLKGDDTKGLGADIVTTTTVPNGEDANRVYDLQVEAGNESLKLVGDPVTSDGTATGKVGSLYDGRTFEAIDKETGENVTYTDENGVEQKVTYTAKWDDATGLSFERTNTKAVHPVGEITATISQSIKSEDVAGARLTATNGASKKDQGWDVKGLDGAAEVGKTYSLKLSDGVNTSYLSVTASQADVESGKTIGQLFEDVTQTSTDPQKIKLTKGAAKPATAADTVDDYKATWNSVDGTLRIGSSTSTDAAQNSTRADLTATLTVSDASAAPKDITTAAQQDNEKQDITQVSGGTGVEPELSFNLSDVAMGGVVSKDDAGKTFSLTFTMSDGSVATLTGNPAKEGETIGASFAGASVTINGHTFTVDRLGDDNTKGFIHMTSDTQDALGVTIKKIELDNVDPKTTDLETEVGQRVATEVPPTIEISASTGTDFAKAPGIDGETYKLSFQDKDGNTYELTATKEDDKDAGTVAELFAAKYDGSTAARTLNIDGNEYVVKEDSGAIKIELKDAQETGKYKDIPLNFDQDTFNAKFTTNSAAASVKPDTNLTEDGQVDRKGTPLALGSKTYSVDDKTLKVGDSVTIDGKKYVVADRTEDTDDENTIKIGKENFLNEVAGLVNKSEANSGIEMLVAEDGKSFSLTEKPTVIGTDVQDDPEKPDYGKGLQRPDNADLSATFATNSNLTKTTIEIDAVKLKTNDKVSIKLDGREYTYTVKDGDKADDVIKGLIDADGNKITENGGTQKGNAIIVEGKKVDVYSGFEARKEDDNSFNAVRIQVGALEGEQLSISIDAMNTKGLNLDDAHLMADISENPEHLATLDQDAAGAAITAVRAAINKVSDQRATLGAMQNRLDHKIANLKISSENLSAAESRIRDVDMAQEMTNFTKNNILSQASTAMLAQANALPQNVLSLLG